MWLKGFRIMVSGFIRVIFRGIWVFDIYVVVYVGYGLFF